MMIRRCPGPEPSEQHYRFSFHFEPAPVPESKPLKHRISDSVMPSLLRRIEKLEAQARAYPPSLQGYGKLCARIDRRAYASLSDEELDLYSEYCDDVAVGLQPSPAAIAAAQSFEQAREGNFRIAGFRSREQFEEAWRRESVAGSSASQYTLPDGKVFKDWYWRFWQCQDAKLPTGAIRMGDGLPYNPPVTRLSPLFSVTIHSWNIGVPRSGASGSLGQERCSEYSVGQVWGFMAGSAYLLEEFRAALNVRRAAAAIRILYRRWPDASSILIENTRVASPVITALGEDIPGLTLIDPGKVDQGEASLGHELKQRLRSGHVYIPHPCGYTWVPELIEEFAGFPHHAETGQIRAMAQALRRFPECQEVTGTLRTA